MENRAHALVAGLFALLLITGVLLTFWWFTGGGEEYRIYELETTRGVTGLNNQAAVRFRGVRVGRVMDIDLDDDDPYRVIVTIRVKSQVPMTHGSFATLGFQGLTGNAFVLLDDTGKDKRPIKPKGQDPIRIPLQPGLMDQGTDTTRKILTRANDITQNAEKILRPENIERIDNALKNLAASTAHLEKTLNQTPALMQDIRRFASPEAANSFKNTLAQIGKLSQDLNQQLGQKVGPAVDNWNRTLGKVEAAGARIDRLGGDLQNNLAGETLPRINQLTEQLQQTSQQLSSVMEELQRNPQMLLSGRAPAALGPGEKP